MTNNVKEAKARAEAMKAKGLIDDAAKEAARLTNQETAREHVFATAETYGATASEGDMSQTKLAFLFNQAVRERILTEEDAGKVYLAYAKGYNAASAAKGEIEIAGVKHGVSGDIMSDAERGKGAEKTAISIFRSFGRVEVVAQGLGLYREVRETRELLGADDRAQSSLFNAFVAVNRDVSRAADASDKPDADFVLADAERAELIAKAITKDAKGGKTDAEKLAALVAAVGKLNKTGNFAGLDAVIAALAMVQPKVVSFVPGPQTLVKADDYSDAA